MNRSTLVAAALAASLLALPATAAAKGPSHASVEGEGLGSPLTFTGNGEPGSGAPLGTLAMESGLMPAMFGQTPDPMLRERPKGDLGPRYTITYTVPGPSGNDTIRQHLYPYAKDGPVTYTAPGQRFFGGDRTRGGWFQGAPELKSTLVAAGLPPTASASPAASGSADDVLFQPAAATTALAVLAVLGAMVFFVLRRRPHTPAAR